jgi:hemin uptake protein HemP
VAPRQPTASPLPPAADGKPAPPAAQPAVLASSDLLRGGRMVEIRHNGEVYRLQATRLGKLILTK